LIATGTDEQLKTACDELLKEIDDKNIFNTLSITLIWAESLFLQARL
jgi:hypothetical protein